MPTTTTSSQSTTTSSNNSTVAALYQYFLDRIFPPILMLIITGLIGLFSWLNVRVSSLEVTFSSHQAAQEVQEENYKQSFLEIKVGQEEIKADIKALLKEHGSANVKP
jgi:hypothetical protein